MDSSVSLWRCSGQWSICWEWKESLVHVHLGNWLIWVDSANRTGFPCSSASQMAGQPRQVELHPIIRVWIPSVHLPFWTRCGWRCSMSLNIGGSSLMSKPDMCIVWLACWCTWPVMPSPTVADSSCVSSTDGCLTTGQKPQETGKIFCCLQRSFISIVSGHSCSTDGTRDRSPCSWIPPLRDGEHLQESVCSIEQYKDHLSQVWGFPC